MSISSTRSDRTAETLRLVLPLLSANGSDCGPQSYALWFEYVAGTNAELKATLDAVVRSKSRLTEADTQRLFAELVLAGDGRTLDDIRKALLQVVGGVSSAADRTRASSERFLQEIELTVEGPVRDEPAAPRLADQARQMVDSLVSLNDRLTESQAQIEQLRGQLEQVRQEAMTDPLTRLANRRAFDEALARLLGGPPAAGARTLASLVMVDVDHFKRINDEMGHVFGDRVLRAVADVLSRSVKGKDLVARFGGEEFAVLLPGTGTQAACRVAEQLCEAVAAIRIRRSGSDQVIAQVTVSCGVTELARGESAGMAIERADSALYRAKRLGRNRVVAGQ